MRMNSEVRKLFFEAVEQLREGFPCPGCEEWLDESIGAWLKVLDWKVWITCPYCKERWELKLGIFDEKENPQLITGDS